MVAQQIDDERSSSGSCSASMASIRTHAQQTSNDSRSVSTNYAGGNVPPPPQQQQLVEILLLRGHQRRTVNLVERVDDGHGLLGLLLRWWWWLLLLRWHHLFSPFVYEK